MKRYHVGDRTVLLVEGELFERLLPIEGLDSAVPLKPLAKKRGPKLGTRMPSASQISKNMERKRRHHLGPEAEDLIREELKSGMGLTEACKKYDISVSTFYRLKNESRSKPVREE